MWQGKDTARVWVSGFGFRVWDFEFRVSSFGFRVSSFGFRVPSFGFRVSGFWTGAHLGDDRHGHLHRLLVLIVSEQKPRQHPAHAPKLTFLYKELQITPELTLFVPQTQRVNLRVARQKKIPPHLLSTSSLKGYLSSRMLTYRDRPTASDKVHTPRVVSGAQPRPSEKGTLQRGCSTFNSKMNRRD